MGMYNSEPCTNCGRSRVPEVPIIGYTPHWWTLTSYYGLYGYFCPDCYELVSHNGGGVPMHPKEFKTIAVKQQLIRSLRPNVEQQRG